MISGYIYTWNRLTDRTFDGWAYSEEYFADLTKAYREEIADLYSRGCRTITTCVLTSIGPLTFVDLGNVQIDDPGLAYFCDVNMVKGMRDQGLDPDYLLNLYIQAYKDCLSEKPLGMNIGLHLCRGNYTVSPAALRHTSP